MATILQASAGLMQLAKPGHIYWVAEPPFEQTVVADGTKIWIYDPDLAQVTVKTLHRQLDNSPAALLVGDSDRLLEEFRVCVVPDAGMKPKNRMRTACEWCSTRSPPMRSTRVSNWFLPARSRAR